MRASAPAWTGAEGNLSEALARTAGRTSLRMMRLAYLPALLLPIACAQPSDTAQVLQEVLATHQASIAVVSGQPPAAASAPPVEPTSSPRSVGPGATPNLAGELVGQTPDIVRQWLGEPRLRREEGPAEVWHYQASQCHLDLVLYREDGTRPTWRVAFASARAVGTARRGEAACLRDIARGAERAMPPAEQALAGA